METAANRRSLSKRGGTARPKSSTTSSSSKRAKKVKKPENSNPNSIEPPNKQAPQRLCDIESLEYVTSATSVVRTPTIPTFEKDILVERLKKEITNRFFLRRPSITQVKVKKERRRKRKRKRNGRESKKLKTSGPSVEGEELEDEESKEHSTRVEDGEEAVDGGTPRTKTTYKDEKDRQRHEVFSDIKSRIIIGSNQCTKTLESAITQHGPTPSLIILARDVRPPTILSHIPILAKKLTVDVLLLPGMASVELGTALGMKTAAVITFLPDVGNRKEQGGRRSRRVCENHGYVDSFIEFARAKKPK